MEVDTSGYDVSPDLADKVRVGLAQAYSRNHVATTEFVGTISRDIDTLDDDSRVEGLPRLLSKGTGGAYLADLPRPSQSLSAVKSATYELRVAREKLIDGGAVSSSDTLELDFEPEVNFDELTQEDYRAIAEKVYDDPDRSAVVREDLSGQPEFDAFRMSETGNSIYYEAKNRQRLSDGDIQAQATRLFAYQLLESDGKIDDANMVVFVSNQGAASDLDIEQEWLEIVTFSIETPPGTSSSDLISPGSYNYPPTTAVSQ